MTTWQERALAATAGTMTGAILSAALGVAAEPPSFGRSATITSDGYVMAHFIDRRKVSHSGAFVGSKDDLVDGIVGLADHLQLSEEDRLALYRAIDGWIGLNYQSPGASLFIRTKP